MSRQVAEISGVGTRMAAMNQQNDVALENPPKNCVAVGTLRGGSCVFLLGCGVDCSVCVQRASPLFDSFSFLQKKI
jgi:hypothetical protein